MPSMALVRFIGPLCVLVASTAWGSTFNLLGLGANLPGPLVLTVDGIQVTLSGGARFNSSAATFGIDANNSGGYVDEPNLFDGDETLFIVFNQDVLLDSVTISQYDSQDVGVLLLKAVTEFPLRNGLVDAGGILLKANSTDYRVMSSLGLLTGGTRGFSLDQISVRAVPEPTALGLALVGLAVGAKRRRR